MHDFPPNVDDFGFGTTPLLLLVTLCVSVYFALKVTGSAATCFGWGLTACFFCNWSINSRGWEGDVTYSKPLWDIVLSATIATVACVAVVRNILRAEGWHRWNCVLAGAFGGGPLVIVLLLPGFITPRFAYSRMQCKNNLKHIGLAMHTYHDAYSSFPLAKAGPPVTSWRVNLLPYLENNELYNRYDFDANWNAGSNRSLMAERVQAFSCPQRKVDTNQEGDFLTSYVVPYGSGTIFGDARTTRIRDITDGTSNTMLVAEACGTNIVWSEPRDADVAVFHLSVNGPGPEKHRSDSLLSSYHKDIALVLLADGSVQSVNSDAAANVLQELTTISGDDAQSSQR